MPKTTFTELVAGAEKCAKLAEDLLDARDNLLNALGELRYDMADPCPITDCDLWACWNNKVEFQTDFLEIEDSGCVFDFGSVLNEAVDLAKLARMLQRAHDDATEPLAA